MTMGDKATQLAQTLAQPQEENRFKLPTRKQKVLSIRGNCPLPQWQGL